MIEQSFYSLNDLAKRWTKKFEDEVLPIQILHLGVQNKLDIEVSTLRLNRLLKFPSKYSEWAFSFYLCAKACSKKPLIDGPPGHFTESFSGERRIQPMETLSSETVEEILFALQSCDGKTIDTNRLTLKRAPVVGDYIVIGTIRKNDDDNYAPFQDPLTLDLDCFFVSHESVLVYEKSLVEVEAETPAILSESKEQTYLAVIAALLEKKLSDSEVKIYQDTVAYEIEKKYGRPNNGLSHSQLTKLFSKANKALSEKLKV